MRICAGMSFFGDLTDKFKKAAKDLANGARGFMKGLIDGTTTGNSIGTLLGMAGCGIAAIFLGGLTLPAIITGITVGALCGVVGGAIVGSLRGASENGAKLEEAEQDSAPATAPAEEKAVSGPSIAIPQTVPAQAVKPESQSAASVATSPSAPVIAQLAESTKFRDRYAPPASDAAEQRQPAISR
jgi:hypothetical protein